VVPIRSHTLYGLKENRLFLAIFLKVLLMISAQDSYGILTENIINFTHNLVIVLVMLMLCGWHACCLLVIV